MTRKTKMISVFLAGIVLTALGFIGCQWAVLRAGKGRLYSTVADLPASDVGLVLGTSEILKNGQPNRFFTYRIDAAADLYKAGKIQRLLVSGDHRHANYDEPAMMKRRLIEAGVPESAITLDHAGFRTLDSVVRAHSVFGLTRFVLISQRFHNQRALLIADRHGLDAIAFCARDVHATSALKTRLREGFARVKAVLDLYLLQTQPKFPGPPEPME